MNRLHHWYCNREGWKRHVCERLVPPAIERVELGDDVLEVGPGFGPATEVLAARGGRLTALELDPGLAAGLRERVGERVDVVEGDGAAMPFPDGRFSGAACFTMLHHVPSAKLQDRLFGEVGRVLGPGCPFVGTDSLGRGLGFAALHIGDTRVVVDPDDLPRRLEAAGFEDVVVERERDWVRWAAARCG